MIGTKAATWVVGGSLALALLFGIGFCAQRESNRRATHGIVADSLARNTRDATRESQAADTGARTALTEFRDRWHTIRTVDTLKIPVAVLQTIRACNAAVSALEISCARKDRVIQDLRDELEHARNPPPKKRLGYFVEGGYSILDGGAVVGVGATVRVVGNLSLMSKIEGASKGSEWRERPDARAVIGLRISF